MPRQVPISKANKTRKRSVKRAAEGVESAADRARELGAAIIRAGELLQQSAVFLEMIAGVQKPQRGRMKRVQPIDED